MWMLFIYFSCLMVLVRTSNMMLNRSGKSKHPCLAANLKEKAFGLSPLKMTLAVGFSYIALIMLR